MRVRMMARLSRSADEGFTLVELLVSMVIISGVLLALVGVQVSGLRTVSIAKQRQQATALASQVMEELRALPYNTVIGGLRKDSSVDDTTGDPNITSVSGTLYFKPTYNSSINEQLVTSSQTVAPLYPHVQPASTTTLGRVKYDVRDYVTLAGADPTTSGYWLTVIATWTSPVTHNKAKSVALRSLLFSPKGCLSNATHPFSGPCQAFLDGSSGISLSGIVITPQDGSAYPMLAGNDAVSAAAQLPEISSEMQSEQTLSAQAKAVTSGVTYTDGSNVTHPSGLVPASAATSTDPGSGTFGPAASNTTTQSASAATLTGTLAQLVLTPAGSDSGRASTTLSAASGQNCANEAGTSLTGGQACGSAQMTPSGTLSAALKLYGKSQTIASIASSGNTNYAFSGRFLTSSGSTCPTAATPGCVHTGATRSLGTATFGGTMSGAVAPAGFTNLATITGYQVTANSESGVGTTTSSASRAGSLSYWNGSGYTTVALTGTSAATYTMPAVTQTFANDGHNVVITTSGQVKLSPVGTTPSGSSPCQPTACGIQTTAGGVVTTLFFTVTVDGATVANFTAASDLGSALATTTYRAAPSA